MIRFDNRWDAYSYRIASATLDSTVDTLEEGQFVTFNAQGNLVLAGKDSKKAWIAMGSARPGRNQVAGKIVRKISFLHGAWGLEITNYDTDGSYTEPVTPLTVVNGVVTPSTATTDLIVAYAIGAPKNGVLTVMSA